MKREQNVESALFSFQISFAEEVYDANEIGSCGREVNDPLTLPGHCYSWFPAQLLPMVTAL